MRPYTYLHSFCFVRKPTCVAMCSTMFLQSRSNEGLGITSYVLLVYFWCTFWAQSFAFDFQTKKCVAGTK